MVVVVVGWGGSPSEGLRGWGVGGGGERGGERGADGGRREGKLRSVKKDKEEDIDETYGEKRVGVEAHFDISPSTAVRVARVCRYN